MVLAGAEDSDARAANSIAFTSLTSWLPVYKISTAISQESMCEILIRGTQLALKLKFLEVFSCRADQLRIRVVRRRKNEHIPQWDQGSANSHLL